MILIITPHGTVVSYDHICMVSLIDNILAGAITEELLIGLQFRVNAIFHALEL